MSVSWSANRKHTTYVPGVALKAIRHEFPEALGEGSLQRWRRVLRDQE